MDLADWRRQNINRLIKELHDTVKEVRPDASVRREPFRNLQERLSSQCEGRTRSVPGPLRRPGRMAEQGWVDYLSPQLYWRDKSAQSFSSAFAVVAKPGDQPKRHSNLSQYRDRSIGRIVRMAVERNRIATRHRDDDQTEVFRRIYSLECRTAAWKTRRALRL